MNVILFGMKGCGKSVLGRKAAKILKCPFIDTDLLIEEAYYKSQKQKLCPSEIYTKIGDKGFRSLEVKVIHSLEKIENAVISVGGGAMMEKMNIEFLTKLGSLIYLMQDKEVLRRRIFSNKSLPAYFDMSRKQAFFEEIYEKRGKHFKSIKSTHLDLFKLSEHEAIQWISKVKNGQ